MKITFGPARREIERVYSRLLHVVCEEVSGSKHQELESCPGCEHMRLALRQFAEHMIAMRGTGASGKLPSALNRDNRSPQAAE